MPDLATILTVDRPSGFLCALAVSGVGLVLITPFAPPVAPVTACFGAPFALVCAVVLARRVRAFRRAMAGPRVRGRVAMSVGFFGKKNVVVDYEADGAPRQAVFQLTLPRDRYPKGAEVEIAHEAGNPGNAILPDAFR